MTASGISRGPGIAGTSAANRYNANNWTTGGSVDANDYFEFTLTPNALFAINLTSFVYTGQVSSGSPSFAFRSSLDGFTSNIGTPNAAGTTISLSAAAYQNLTSAITFRFYVYGIAAAGTTYSINDFTFNGTVISTSMVDWANLQFPNATTSVNVGTPVTYYARVYEPGVTVGAGQGAGITAWIGYSTTNSNPSGGGWTWVAATYNAGYVDPSNDEYQANLNLPTGVYYVASRFQLGAGTYRYGGYNAGGGGFWDGTANVSQVLIVNDNNTVDWCNIQAPATGNLVLGGVFDIYGQVYEPSVTPGAGFQGAGISAWLGYSTSNIDPSGGGWTWVPMNFNAFGGGDDNDEYMLDIGSYLTLPGTYYYATRFQLNGGSYRYGGILASGVNGGFWDGVTYISGVLTVTSPPQQEINLQGQTGGTNNIVSGSVTPSGLNNTQFAATAIGSSSTKDYRIENTGTATLNLTGVPRVTLGGANPGDFSVTTQPAVASIAPGNNTTFIITFTPTATGTRSAIVSIPNNDADENPYTFMIQGNATCSAATNVLTPASGPAGTEVTVTASVNNLTGATATFNGVAVPVTAVDATHIKVVIPANAISGNLVTTNAAGCTATNYFPVTTVVTGSCAGGNTASDLFISEVTDATAGGLSYIEIYNGTANPINLGNYGIQIYSNGGSTVSSSLNLNSVVLNSGSIYLVAMGVASSPTSSNTCTGVTGGNGELANQSSTAPGINFDPGGNDHIALVNISTNTKVDSFGTYLSSTWADGLGLGDRGAVFRRKNTAVVPSVTHNNNDWVITDWAGSGSGSCGTNDYSNIGTYVFTPAIPPTVTQHPVFSPSCKSISLTVSGVEGVIGGASLAYQWYFVPPNTANWTAVSDGGIYSGATTSTLTISSIAGLDGYQFYCQIRENGATCYAASDAVKITESQTVTWNGSWSPTSPDSNMIAVINAPYNTAVNGSFEACSLTVNSTLTVGPDDYVTVYNDLTVSVGATLTVQDDGSLVMVENDGVVTNNGTTNIIRITPQYRQFDYMYWSAPVYRPTIGASLPGWRTDYAFRFETANYADVLPPFDSFDDDSNAWVYTPPATQMIEGQGYAVMAPTSVPFTPLPTATVTFSGRVNNGIITIPMYASANPASTIDDFNLIGNPYPSSIFADDFIDANPYISGTLYFWTHNEPISNTAPGPDQYNFITDDYAMYNYAGGTGTGGVASGTGSEIPNGYIASCEGFFVEYDDAAPTQNAVFRNEMRRNNNNSQFFRPAAAPQGTKDRIWLNLQNPLGLFSQQLIGYFPNATMGVDRGFDGIVNKTTAAVSFYSLIGDDYYRIQGRPSFDIHDQVPIGYATQASGAFTISIDSSEGILANLETPIYLEDKMLGIVHDLRQAPYQFTTQAGTFNGRFVLKYSNTSLGSDDFESMQNQVAIAVSDNGINVKSYSEAIESVAVYDIVGRRVFAKDGIGGNDFRIDAVVANEQALIVKVTLQNGAVVTRKIVY